MIEMIDCADAIGANRFVGFVVGLLAGAFASLIAYGIVNK